MHIRYTALLVFFLSLGGSIPVAAQSETKLKIGFISTFTGPGAILGEHMRKGAELALRELGEKIGGVSAEILFRDDQMKPEVGLQAAMLLLEKDKVSFMSGVIWSNVMLVVAPSVARANVLMIGAVGGPQEIAGAGCLRNVFVVSNQTAQAGEAMGAYLSAMGTSNVYVMAPNYAAGRDIIEGFKRTFKGTIVRDDRTKLGSLDFQAEMSQIRASSPSAVVVFYPGGMGIQFVNQYAQAGLRGRIPLYGIFTQDHLTLPAQKNNALNNFDIAFWNHDLTNERNRKFVSRFKETYGHLPGLYAATSYDAIKLIDYAVKSVNGKVAEREKMIAAIEKAKAKDFGSVRDSFAFNVNHFPIQNFYLLQISNTPEYGLAPVIKGIALPEAKDSFYQECKMGPG